MEVSLLARKKKKDNLVLVHITGPVAESEAQRVAEFTDALMNVAYRGACSHSPMYAHSDTTMFKV